MRRPLPLLAVLFAPTVLLAQALTPPALVRAEAGSCARCTLKLEYVATVGSADDKELLNDRAALLALHDGKFISFGEGLMPLYDARGRYLRTVGKLGAGPGEYRSSNAATVARGDSVALYAYGRITTLSVATGKGNTVQSLERQSAFRLLILPDGSVLAQNYAGSPGAFIVMAPDATVTTTFGIVGDSVRYPTGLKGVDYDDQQFAIALSPRGGFWAARMNYRPSLERWSERGGVLQTIAHRPSWFTHSDYEAQKVKASQSVATSPIFPRVLGIWADSKDQLFVIATVPDANWRRDPNAPDPQARGERNAAPPKVPTGGYSRYIDGIIDVYDGKAGSLLGSWRADEWPGMPIGEGMIAHRIQSEDGIYSFHVWRMVLSRP